jgi:hypothetical protein
MLTLFSLIDYFDYMFSPPLLSPPALLSPFRLRHIFRHFHFFRRRHFDTDIFALIFFGFSPLSFSRFRRFRFMSRRHADIARFSPADIFAAIFSADMISHCRC